MAEINIGPRLVAWRTLRGLSQEKIGEVAGMSKQLISYVENGTRDITVQKLNRICTKALKTDLVTFLGPIPDPIHGSRAA
jgi:transcriptional regulator with XRE-family HTH domain